MGQRRGGLVGKQGYELGRRCEIALSKSLKQREWYIIPSYDYTGKDQAKAPRLEGRLKGFVVPDLDVSRAGRRFWIECKYKSRPNPWRMHGGRLYHGLDTRHVNDYLRVQEITGCRVRICILERAGRAVLVNWLDKIYPNRMERPPTKIWRSGSVLFPRDDFDDKGVFDADAMTVTWNDHA